MERKFATGGPNKQMYEMYHMSMRQSNDLNADALSAGADDAGAVAASASQPQLE